MNAQNHSGEATAEQLNAILSAQKAAFLEEGAVSAETRIDRIERAISQLLKYQDQITEAINEDYGQRSLHHSKMMDVGGSVGPMVHAKKHVRQWMRADKRKTTFPFNLFGARSRVEYQPLGVVGIISPWNFPFNLTFAPLANVFAAGNRAMIKPSEFTPITSALMDTMITEVFDPTEVAVVTGGPEVGQAFTSLAFDHLIFTGATSVAKHVMAAAAKNLVPVTLELGGKSPVIIGRSADLTMSCDRIMWGKITNAGQICLAPDYTFVPEEQVDAFVEGLKQSAASLLPTMAKNPDYTAIVNDRHYQRLQQYLADAREKGATIVEINPAGETFDPQSRIMAPTLIINASDDMLVMQEEIFGPLMPIRAYQSIDQATSYINANPRPLGLYYFGTDKDEERTVLDRTTSGGVTINDVIMHVGQEDLPFGGVGPSGMGNYHGYDGFKTFSHARSIYTQSKIDVSAKAGLKPPFSDKTDKALASTLKG